MDAIALRHMEAAISARSTALGWHRLATSYVDTPKHYHPEAMRARDEAAYHSTEWYRRQASFHAALTPLNHGTLMAEYTARIAGLEATEGVLCEIPFLPAEASCA